MIVHQVYAMVDEKGMVQNVTVGDNYEEANRIARAVYGEKAIAVDCLQHACIIGDIYIEGRFYRETEDGIEEVPYIPTQEQQVQRLTKENNELTVVLADMIGGAV